MMGVDGFYPDANFILIILTVSLFLFFCLQCLDRRHSCIFKHSIMPRYAKNGFKKEAGKPNASIGRRDHDTPETVTV